MRTIAAPAQAVLNGAVCPLVLLVEMLLSSPARLCSAPHAVVHGGNTFDGLGNFGSIEEVADSPGDNKALRFTISGVPSESLALAMAEDIRNKPINVWMAVLDPDAHAVLDAPLLWAGTLDQMPIRMGDGTSSISVTAEHRGATFARPKPLRYTAVDQQRLHAGDTGLRFVTSQANQRLVWPAAAYWRQ